MDSSWPDRLVAGLRRFLGRVAYRLRQARSVLWPQVDPVLLAEARSRLPPRWRAPFDRLGGSEKAHVLRLYRAIAADPALSEADREALITLALTHDLGKAITRPTFLERVVKTLLPIPNRAHPILGARLLRRLGAPPALVRRVARHHRAPGNDRLLALFQRYDDSL
ncbi:MAG: hypothetical protein OZSIB_2912 [Candidatus Ozemobacter sibiricus]|uniref:HD domain-containing protein n=1 Tax=Candidatus Ozemobacter sibiricus TaxID=2268124 RepID=A0A367ZS84_9BACT|nr:MAG: hypothetical protein OZSIB_2912 [Candidatus Ozemobacter sibiricus]